MSSGMLLCYRRTASKEHRIWWRDFVPAEEARCRALFEQFFFIAVDQNLTPFRGIRRDDECG